MFDFIAFAIQQLSLIFAHYNSQLQKYIDQDESKFQPPFGISPSVCHTSMFGHIRNSRCLTIFPLPTEREYLGLLTKLVLPIESRIKPLLQTISFQPRYGMKHLKYKMCTQLHTLNLTKQGFNYSKDKKWINNDI